MKLLAADDAGADAPDDAADDVDEEEEAVCKFEKTVLGAAFDDVVAAFEDDDAVDVAKRPAKDV